MVTEQAVMEEPTNIVDPELGLEGGESVSAELVFDPPWTPDRMSEDAKFALGF